MKINLARSRNGLPRRNWRVLRAEMNIGSDRGKLSQFYRLRRVWKLALEHELKRPRVPYIILDPGAVLQRGRRHQILNRTLNKLEDLRRAGANELRFDEILEPKLLVDVLTLLLRNEDARGVVYETLKHRPTATVLPKALTLYVVLHCRSGETEKAVKIDLAKLAGVTQDQIKHGLAKYRDICELVVESFDAPSIDALQAWNLRDLLGGYVTKRKRQRLSDQRTPLGRNRTERPVGENAEKKVLYFTVLAGKK